MCMQEGEGEHVHRKIEPLCKGSMQVVLGNHAVVKSRNTLTKKFVPPPP